MLSGNVSRAQAMLKQFESKLKETEAKLHEQLSAAEEQLKRPSEAAPAHDVDSPAPKAPLPVVSKLPPPVVSESQQASELEETKMLQDLRTELHQLRNAQESSMREREAGLALRERRQAAIGVATEYNAEIVRLRALALAPAPEASIGSGLSGLGGGLSGGASKGAYLAAFLQRVPAPSKAGPTAAGRRQQMEARLVARVEARRARVKLAVGQHFTAAPESNDKDSPEDDTIAPPRKLPSALPVEAAHPGSVHAVALEGSLLKFRRHVGAWHKRYCVLYEDSCELTYYEGHAVAAWGRVYGKVSPPRARGAVTRDTLRRRVCQTARARRTGVQLDQARVAQDG